MSIVLVDAVRIKMGKTSLTTLETAAITAKIDEVQSDLEKKLWHLLERRQYTMSCQATWMGTINLIPPVIEINSLKIDDNNPMSEEITGYSFRADIPNALQIPNAEPGRFYKVVYYGGDLIPDASAVSLVADVVTRSEIVGVSIASGALSSLNVEGTSVGFGGAYAPNGGDMDGIFTRAEMSRVKHLRRVITR